MKNLVRKWKLVKPLTVSMILKTSCQNKCQSGIVLIRFLYFWSYIITNVMFHFPAIISAPPLHPGSHLHSLLSRIFSINIFEENFLSPDVPQEATDATPHFSPLAFYRYPLHLEKRMPIVFFKVKTTISF